MDTGRMGRAGFIVILKAAHYLPTSCYANALLSDCSMIFPQNEPQRWGQVTVAYIHFVTGWIFHSALDGVGFAPSQVKTYIDTALLWSRLTTQHVEDAGETILCSPRYGGTNPVLTQGRVRLGKTQTLHNQAFVVGNRNAVPHGVWGKAQGAIWRGGPLDDNNAHWDLPWNRREAEAGPPNVVKS